MIRRLVESHYEQFRDNLTYEQVRFWLSESRTAEMLTRLVSEYPEQVNALLQQRPLLKTAKVGNRLSLNEQLDAEQAAERKIDEVYWQPLRRELEMLRQRPDRR